MNNSKSHYQRRAEYLAKLENLPEKEQAINLAIILRALKVLLEQEHAKTLVNGGLYLPLPGSAEVKH